MGKISRLKTSLSPTHGAKKSGCSLSKYTGMPYIALVHVWSVHSTVHR